MSDLNLQYYTNPNAPTLGATYDATISGSTSVSIVAGATWLEVSAAGQGIFLNWGATASSSAFVEYISPGITRVYAIPINPLTGVRYTTVEFIQEAATARLAVIQK